MSPLSSRRGMLSGWRAAETVLLRGRRSFQSRSMFPRRSRRRTSSIRRLRQFGSLDILVNNAGRAHAGGLMSSTEEDWTEMTAVKLTSMRRLCKAAIPDMREKRWGRIVNMSSIGGIYPNPKLFVSHVLSAAINNLTKSLALKLRPTVFWSMPLELEPSQPTTGQTI